MVVLGGNRGFLISIPILECHLATLNWQTISFGGIWRAFGQSGGHLARLWVFGPLFGTLIPGKINWKFHVDIFIKRVSRRDVSSMVILGGHWGFLEDRVIPDIIDDLLSPQGSYPENFMLISLLEVCQEGGWPPWRYLEDFEGSWSKTWRTGSYLT